MSHELLGKKDDASAGRGPGVASSQLANVARGAFCPVSQPEP